MIAWVLVFYMGTAYGAKQITAIVPMQDKATCLRFRDEILTAVGQSAGQDSDLLACRDIRKGKGSIDP
jgi:hypothetical protein